MSSDLEWNFEDPEDLEWNLEDLEWNFEDLEWNFEDLEDLAWDIQRPNARHTFRKIVFKAIFRRYDALSLRFGVIVRLFSFSNAP